jgi:hypothetical protein
MLDDESFGYQTAAVEGKQIEKIGWNSTQDAVRRFTCGGIAQWMAMKLWPLKRREGMGFYS